MVYIIKIDGPQQRKNISLHALLPSQNPLEENYSLPNTHNIYLVSLPKHVLVVKLAMRSVINTIY